MTVARIATGEDEETGYEQPERVKSGKAGGKARAELLGLEERRAIARRAALARWEIKEGVAMKSQLVMNCNAYEGMREKMEAEHFGRVALLHDGELIAIYNDSGDAYEIGCEKFGLGEFTIEKIGEQPISLGIFTMSVPPAKEG